MNHNQLREGGKLCVYITVSESVHDQLVFVNQSFRLFEQKCSTPHV